MALVFRNRILGLTLLALAGTGCASSPIEAGSDTAATIVAATVFALQTNAAALETELAATVELPPASASPAATILPEATSTPQNPLVIQVALCWGGPGKAYVVVSSIAAGSRVELLGVGRVAGWYVVQNPIYHDRCWIEAKNLQLDPVYDLSKLKVFNPPPTPGPKATEGPSPTP